MTVVEKPSGYFPDSLLERVLQTRFTHLLAAAEGRMKTAIATEFRRPSCITTTLPVRPFQ
jgi:hypothetical protein